VNPVELYTSIRAEIISNQVMMHWFTLIVALILLAGLLAIETRGRSILSAFLPLLSLAWAAAIVRFDFFIHRQAAYLRDLEGEMVRINMAYPLWETWKSTLRATPIVVPVLDGIAAAVIVVPTLYLLFGPAQKVFEERAWRGRRLYAWSTTILLLSMLLSLVAIPRIAAYR